MIKVGIIGSGFGLYGLLPAFNSLKNCQVTAICGKNTPRLLNYCHSIGLENIYSDWKLMLDNEPLDAVAIATTPNAQYQIAKVAINKSLNIFAEKPLATNYHQAEELFNLAKKRNITTAVDFIFPEIEQWKKIKSLLDSKKYGKLKYISSNWDFLSFDIDKKKLTWKTKLEEGGGALSFYFSHCLYYLEYYAGEIVDIKASLSYSKESLGGGEVGVDLLLDFKNRVKGYAHLRCDVRGLNRHQLIFNCQKGTIILENENSITDDFHIKIYTETKINQLDVPKNRTKIKDEDERVKVIRKIAARFVDSCIQRKPMVPSFKEGARVQKLIEKIRLSSKVHNH